VDNKVKHSFRQSLDSLFIQSFIHSGYFYSAFTSSTTQRHSWLQHGYSVGVSMPKRNRQL